MQMEADSSEEEHVITVCTDVPTREGASAGGKACEGAMCGLSNVKAILRIRGSAQRL